MSFTCVTKQHQNACCYSLLMPFRTYKCKFINTEIDCNFHTESPTLLNTVAYEMDLSSNIFCNCGKNVSLGENKKVGFELVNCCSTYTEVNRSSSN